MPEYGCSFCTVFRFPSAYSALLQLLSLAGYLLSVTVEVRSSSKCCERIYRFPMLPTPALHVLSPVTIEHVGWHVLSPVTIEHALCLQTSFARIIWCFQPARLIKIMIILHTELFLFPMVHVFRHHPRMYVLDDIAALR